jgi:uncharacterized protein YndB with AHSA1/START domain
MPAQLQATAKTNLEIDRDAHTIRLTRIFDAPRTQIFEAWTRPEQVTCWWDAAGEPLTACEIDLQPGDVFKFVTKGHPEMPFVGTYREITSPDPLVFEAIGAKGLVVLRDVTGKTHMTVEIECRSAEQLEQYLKWASISARRKLSTISSHMCGVDRPLSLEP